VSLGLTSIKQPHVCLHGHNNNRSAIKRGCSVRHLAFRCSIIRTMPQTPRTYAGISSDLQLAAGLSGRAYRSRGAIGFIEPLIVSGRTNPLHKLSAIHETNSDSF
jgi:hypothetical protein